jgi:general secretion pathway protein C
MRGLGFLTFAAAVAFGYGGGQLALVMASKGTQGAAPVQIGAALAAVEAATPEALPTDWPPVFDAYVPDPPRAQAPPKKQEKYRLVGLVAGGKDGWAIMTASDGDVLVRAGDRLIGGEQVIEIEANGVWIEREEKRVLIRFEETANEMMARVTSNGSVESDNVDVPFDAFSGRDMRRVLGRAGSVRMVAANGGQGEKFPEILWVREGQIYDLIGLERGDMVLRVNGYSVSDPETLANAAQIFRSSDEFAVDILRKGQRRTITVSITGRG